MTQNVFMVVLYLFFITLAHLTLINMLIGVLCEVISGVGTYEREKSTIEFAKLKLQDMYEEIDGESMAAGVDETGFISLLKRPDCQKILEGLEIDPFVLIDMSDVIFDEDSKYVRQSGGYLLFNRFLEVILEFRASQNARVTDVVLAHHFGIGVEGRWVGERQNFGRSYLGCVPQVAALMTKKIMKFTPTAN